MKINEELKEEIVQFIKFNKEIDAIFEKLNDIFGCKPASKFFEAIYKMIEAYLKNLDNKFGNHWGYGWIEWFIYENEYGKKRFDVIIDGYEKKINTIYDLFEIIERD